MFPGTSHVTSFTATGNSRVTIKDNSHSEVSFCRVLYTQCCLLESSWYPPGSRSGSFLTQQQHGVNIDNSASCSAWAEISSQDLEPVETQQFITELSPKGLEVLPWHGVCLHCTPTCSVAAKPSKFFHTWGGSCSSAGKTLTLYRSKCQLLQTDPEAPEAIDLFLLYIISTQHLFNCPWMDWGTEGG